MKIRPPGRMGGGGEGRGRNRVSIVLLYPFLFFSEVLTRDIYISLTWPGTPPTEGFGHGGGSGALRMGVGGEQGGLALIRPSDCFSSSSAQRAPPPRNDD